MGMTDRHFVDDLDLIEADFRAGNQATVQFTEPIGDTLDITLEEESEQARGFEIPSRQIAASEYIARVRQMLTKWGEKLTIRFYDHFGEVFDGNCVHIFPETQSLHLGGLSEVENLDAAFTLPHLKRLCLACYWLKDRKLLTHLNFDQLTELVIDQTDTKALDLAPLAQAHKLKRLYLASHHKNIDELSALSSLEKFTLSAKTGLDLSFINGMTNLRTLNFNLGGTRSIADIALPKLEDIAFSMTRNLSELGDMQRFPKLRRLFMQDQQQIESAQFGAGNSALEHLWFYNCGKLTNISGLDQCGNLKSLRWTFTDRDPASLKLPKSLTHLHMLSGKRGRKEPEKAAIQAMGYIADDHEDSWFFWK